MSCFHWFIVFYVLCNAEKVPELCPVFVGAVLALFVDGDDASRVLTAEVSAVVYVEGDVGAAVPGNVNRFVKIREPEDSKQMVGKHRFPSN